MKRRIKIGILLAFFAILAGQASAQHYIGVRGGYSGGYARFDYNFTHRDNREFKYLFGWPSGGISWKYYTAERNVGAIQVDLQMVKKGYRILSDARLVNDNYEYRDFYDRTLSTVELPFMWHMHFYAFKRRARIFVNLGMYVSYIYDSYEKSGKTDGWVVESEGKYTMNSVRDNMFEYGLCGGVGLSYMFGRYEVFAEARYSFGYGDIFRSASKYPESQYNRTPVDMINISAGLYYRLGKGGIRAFENPRVRIPKQPWGDRLPQGPGGTSQRNTESQGQQGQQGNQQNMQRPGNMPLY
ncbi:PorT family protein [Alistipes sp. OttesenSCG-928-L06]|nr:PorT family protein [Alistipes sp. OttesenSCG-928-L06]